MSPSWNRVLDRLKSLNYRIRGIPDLPASPPVDVEGQAASDLIRRSLESPDPVMITRFGHIEIQTLACHHQMVADKPWLRKSIDYVEHRTGRFWWDATLRSQMEYSCGFFPVTDPYLRRYSELHLELMPEIDILGSWLSEERFFLDRLPQATLVPLIDLEPYFHDQPWTIALQGRKVLVIHPFERTIRSQYRRRTELFKDPTVLPEFELQTLRAVQSAVYADHDFENWFQALSYMEDQIDRIDFDIAIIGAGAYGMPLAAHVKSIGRKAVHLGGATQILFGIRGKRWDDRPEFRAMYNDAWARPSEDEVPTQHRVLEGGAYW